MRMQDLTVNADGYIVDPASGAKVLFYECDPQKNILCAKALCRGCSDLGDGEVGFCASTPEPAFAKDGARPFYKRLKEDGYFGREFLKEGDAGHDD